MIDTFAFFFPTLQSNALFVFHSTPLILSFATEITKKDQELIYDAVVYTTLYFYDSGCRTGKDRMCERNLWIIHSVSSLNGA
jgi:hypothetical protein